jgi:two-component system, chemotaxis family, CheB/CheR fusion protein
LGLYRGPQNEFDRRLLTQFSPATAFVNEDFEVVQTRGDVGRYLKLAPGRASLNILKMAREGLLLDLRSALNKAKKDNVKVQKTNVQLKNGNDDSLGTELRSIDFEVQHVAIGNSKEQYLMIVFRDSLGASPSRRTAARSVATRKESESTSARITKLEQELGATKEYLQAVIETQEATNEELQSANEEILSSNEELQSTNEERKPRRESSSPPTKS